MRVREIRDQTCSQELSDAASFEFLWSQPLISWLAYDLDQDNRDDQLMASALSLAQQGKSVIIATDDFVLQGNATKAGLDYHTPRDDLRLPETETPEERQIKQRLRKMEEIEQAMPVYNCLQEVWDKVPALAVQIALQSPLTPDDAECADYLTGIGCAGRNRGNRAIIGV